jgi:hypothetical protein
MINAMRSQACDSATSLNDLLQILKSNHFQIFEGVGSGKVSESVEGVEFSESHLI